MTWMSCRWRVMVWRKNRDWRHHPVMPPIAWNCDVGENSACAAWLYCISVLIYCLYLSGAFAKLGNSTISFVTCVCLSVGIVKLGSHLTDFHEMWYLSFFSKNCRENPSFIKIGQECLHYIKTTRHVIKKNPTRCNNVSKFYYSIFIWSSTCFGRHTAHRQEPKTALAASGFSYVEGC